MYIAFVDESGSHGSTRVLAMATYAAHAVEWARLEHDWKRLLGRMGVATFHMVDCVHRVRDFEGWSQERSNAAIREVVDLILGFNVHGLAAAVLLGDYDQIVTGRARDEVGTPWHLCFRDLLRGVSERIERLPQSEWVAFVCDLQDEFSAEAERLYRRIRETPNWPNRNRLGTLTFGSRLDWVGLQVADVLAYETFRHLDNTLYCDRGIRKSLDRLKEGRPYFGQYYDISAII
jgi:hypothetical protein